MSNREANNGFCKFIFFTLNGTLDPSSKDVAVAMVASQNLLEACEELADKRLSEKDIKSSTKL
ncbi:MAG: hypothetical protein NE334_19615 [Lentisphaeraceae bacterium]|nr:hypothetical protein [Lentisphaeraceae bacterium]